MTKKNILVILSFIPMLLGFLLINSLSNKNKITFNRTTDLITVIKKSYFGFTKHTEVYKLSSYSEAYLANPSAYYINIIPNGSGSYANITITGNWWKNRDVLQGYVDQINSFLKNPSQNEMTITIPIYSFFRIGLFGFILSICISAFLIVVVLRNRN